MVRSLFALLLSAPAIAAAQSATLDKLAQLYGKCVETVTLSQEDEYRYLRKSADSEALRRVAKIGKCQDLRAEEVEQLRRRFVRLGLKGEEVASELAKAEFTCELTVHQVLDVEAVTKRLIPAEQAVYECTKPISGLVTCSQFVVRLMPAGQPPGTSRERHQEQVNLMLVTRDVHYSGCQ